MDERRRSRDLPELLAFQLLELHRPHLINMGVARRIRAVWIRRTMGSPVLDERTMIAMRSNLIRNGKTGLCIRSQPPLGTKRVKKRSITLALCCSLVCSPVYATTFIGILWPLFGPLAAPGLVEFVAELQSMPDVEVVTYWHPEWSSLVDDINRQPEGTHILVVGYSFGANNAVLVANNCHYIDSIIALQPSIFTSNTPLTGSVGRIVEIYNPNPWMTFGGMGSQKLIGANIEYIANNDSHPRAPFNPEFRDLVRSEIARLAAEPIPNATQAKIPEAINADHRH